MSTLKVNNLQVGQDGTAANNYTLYQPASPDGTVRLGYGVAGSVTDILTLKNSRLGIGTDNPNEKLHIHASGTSYVRFTDETTGVGSTDGAIFGLDHPHLYAWNYEAGDFVVATNATEKLRITSAGVVQIGKGDEAASAYQTVEMFVGSTDENYSVIRGKYNRTNEYNRSEVRFGVESNAAGKGFLALATGNNSATERLRITSAGLVGIGNNNPLYKLSVLTSGTTDTSLHLATSGGASDNGDATNSIRFTGGTNTRWANAKYEAFAHIFHGNGAEKLRIDSSGSIITGSGGVSETIGGGAAHIQSNANLSILRRGNVSAGPYLNLAKSRNGTPGNFTVVQDNDYMGSIGFCADDGTDINHPVAYIHGRVNGTPGANDVPGMLTFETTPDGGTQPVERLRIASDGQIGMGKAGAVTVNGNSPLTIQESDSNSETICLRATNSGGNGSQPGIVMKTAAGGHIGGIYCDVNSDYMRLSTSGTDRVFITNTGSVGVNIASPTGNFEVNGNDGINISNATRTGTNGAQWRLIPHNGGGSATNLRLYEGVGAVEVLNATKTGCVTTPYQPTFWAYNNSGSGTVVHSGRYQTVTWGSIYTNKYHSSLGNPHNNSTGTYTVPVAGLYHMFIHCGRRTTYNNWMGLFIYKNSSQIIYTWQPPGSTVTNDEYIDLHLEAYIECAANDALDLCFDNNYSSMTSNALQNYMAIKLVG